MSSDQIIHNLPLFDLFTKLRHAGLPLGIDEYQSVVRALQVGFGISDRNALARLCKALWIKSPVEERLFDDQFEQFLLQAAASKPPSRSLPQPSLEQAETQAFTQSPPPVPVPEPTRTSTTSKETKWTSGDTFSPTIPVTPELAPEIEDEIQVAQAVSHMKSRLDDSDYNPFIQTDEYFPITRRQMKQSWRYLRNPAREGPPVELDIEATVNEYGRQGMLLEPVLIPQRINRTELLLILDQDGSMEPFHALSRRLAETALGGGRLGKANIYYFHNCPVEYLYHDPVRQKAELLYDILNRLHHQRTAVLIFSDSGAARGGMSPARIEMTKEFLDQLKQQVRYVAWLNPAPPYRWPGTTAGEVMRFVPMFDISRRGLDSAIRVLRGLTRPHKDIGAQT